MPVMTKSPRGEDLVILSRKEYDDLVEDRADAAILRRSRTARTLKRGDYLGNEDMDQLLSAKTPLAFWRKKRGVTQEALARRAGVAQGYISEIESGAKRGEVGTLASIAKILSITLDDLVVSEPLRKKK